MSCVQEEGRSSTEAENVRLRGDSPSSTKIPPHNTSDAIFGLFQGEVLEQDFSKRKTNVRL